MNQLLLTNLPAGMTLIIGFGGEYFPYKSIAIERKLSSDNTMEIQMSGQ